MQNPSSAQTPMTGGRSPNKGLTYAEAGVDYEAVDPAKVLAQQAAGGTGAMLGRWGGREVAASRGESAFVWQEGDVHRAFVLECLGTKPLVADATRQVTGKTHYDALAQDTVAMAVNDIAAVGAEPQVIAAYWAVGSSAWFDDRERAADLVNGWARACEDVGATWGGGETPVLDGVLLPDAVDLAAACVGIVSSAGGPILGERLAVGDAVVLLASSGIHANGLTLARRIAAELDGGYATPLSDGRTYGEALLAPTVLYPPVLSAIRDAGVDIHYLSNLTGHGWRKIMRARRDLHYRMTRTPPPGPLFEFLVRQGRLDADEAYGSLNMGAGYAVFVPADQAQLVVGAAQDRGLGAWDAGRVEAGTRQVTIEPAGVIFEGASLQLR